MGERVAEDAAVVVTGRGGMFVEAMAGADVEASRDRTFFTRPLAVAAGLEPSSSDSVFGALCSSGECRSGDSGSTPASPTSCLANVACGIGGRYGKEPVSGVQVSFSACVRGAVESFAVCVCSSRRRIRQPTAKQDNAPSASQALDSPKDAQSSLR